MKLIQVFLFVSIFFSIFAFQCSIEQKQKVLTCPGNSALCAIQEKIKNKKFLFAINHSDLLKSKEKKKEKFESMMQRLSLEIEELSHGTIKKDSFLGQAQEIIDDIFSEKDVENDTENKIINEETYVDEYFKDCSLFLEKISQKFSVLQWTAYLKIVSYLLNVSYTTKEKNFNILDCKVSACIIGFTFDQDIKDKNAMVLKIKKLNYQLMKKNKNMPEPKTNYLKPKVLKGMQHFSYIPEDENDDATSITARDQQNKNNMIYFESLNGKSDIIDINKLTINNKKCAGVWGVGKDFIRNGKADMIIVLKELS